MQRPLVAAIPFAFAALCLFAIEARADGAAAPRDVGVLVRPPPPPVLFSSAPLAAAVPWRANEPPQSRPPTIPAPPAFGFVTARATNGAAEGASESRASYGGSDRGVQTGEGFVVPSSEAGGIGGTRLRASLAFLSPDTWNAGIFYSIDDRWTVGILGQRIRQDRSVSVEGQLIDPNDLSTFIPGFSLRERSTALTFGPFVQFRIFRERGAMPQLHLAAYSMEWGELTSASTRYSNPDLMNIHDGDAASSGERADTYRTVFFSASKNLSLLGDSTILQGLRLYGGFGVGVRSGMRYDVAMTGAGDPRIRVVRHGLTRPSLVAWAGAEVALPAHFSAYGEVFTGDECVFGYGAGLRWNSPIGITLTLGITNCLEAVPQRSLDLIYLPGGVGGQPSLVSGAGGLDSGPTSPPSSFDDDEDRRGRRLPRVGLR